MIKDQQTRINYNNEKYMTTDSLWEGRLTSLRRLRSITSISCPTRGIGKSHKSDTRKQIIWLGAKRIPSIFLLIVALTSCLKVKNPSSAPVSGVAATALNSSTLLRNCSYDGRQITHTNVTPPGGQCLIEYAKLESISEKELLGSVTSISSFPMQKS